MLKTGVASGFFICELNKVDVMAMESTLRRFYSVNNAILASGLLLCLTVLSGCSSVTHYATVPDWESEVGYCGTGLVFADMNNDGYQDMVVSNGNDIERQQVFIFFNRGDGTFNRVADWKSEDFAFNGNLSVGDINRDGYQDLAVSVYLGDDGAYDGGGVKVYMSQGDNLPGMPVWHRTGFPSFNVALGDVNGDGWLDLAVAAGNPIAEDEVFAAQGDLCVPPPHRYKRHPQTMGPDSTPHKSTASVLAFNPRGSGDEMFTPIWESEDQVSMDVHLGDVNKDGYIDLILGNPIVKVFTGYKGGLSEEVAWQASAEDYFVNGLDFAASLDLNTDNEKARVASILAAGNNYMGGGPGRFSLYNFASTYVMEFNPRRSSPVWQSPETGWGSGVLFSDATEDGKLDLIAARWAPAASGVLKAPLEIYQGNGVTFDEKPVFTSDKSSWSVAEILAVSDLDNDALVSSTDHFVTDNRISGPENKRKVLTLKRQNIQSVQHVTVNGSVLKEGEDYLFVPGQNLVYLNEGVSLNIPVSVSYQWSEELDLGVTNWDCDRGNYIFYWR